MYGLSKQFFTRAALAGYQYVVFRHGGFLCQFYRFGHDRAAAPDVVESIFGKQSLFDQFLVEADLHVLYLRFVLEGHIIAYLGAAYSQRDLVSM